MREEIEMRVVSEVTKIIKRSSAALGHEDDEVIFKWPPGNEIPIGAKVTVEWTEMEHTCGVLDIRFQIVRYEVERDGWVWRDRSCGALSSTRVFYCPGCGKKL